MFIMANNILMGYPKPGCRRDDNFFDSTFNRFLEIISIAKDNNASVILTGRHFATMKLELWLRIIDAISHSGVSIFVIATNRPSDDVIAMHRAGHITLLSSGHNRQLPFADQVSFIGDELNIVINKSLLTLHTITGECSTTDGDILHLHNAIQTDEVTPNVIIANTANGKLHITEAPLICINNEHELVSMDYVEALKATSIVSGESIFINRLKDSSFSGTQKTIETSIQELDAEPEVKSYLLDLALRASEHNEFATT